LSDRYSRQILFSPIGKAGQQKLQDKHVLLIGAGALGTSNAEMLIRAGVGKLTIVDRDYVEWSNLQRQQLYTEEDAMSRVPKAIAAKKRLTEINSDVNINGVIADVTIQEIEQLLEEKIDLIIDATDNFETRLLINDAANKKKIPWIYGACTGSYGLTYTVLPGVTPCFSCLLGTMPMGGETCDTVGVIAPAVQIVTAHQVTEALKILVEDYEALRGTLLFFDVWKNQHSSIKVQSLRKAGCPSCSESATHPYLQLDNQSRTAVLCGRDTVQIRPPVGVNRNLQELAVRLRDLEGKVEANPYLVNFSIGEHRLVVFQDGRVLVHGTKDVTEAKTLYNRYIGG
jgi:sulfur carrier protein ThiS adenylyltransferase